MKKCLFLLSLFVIASLQADCVDISFFFKKPGAKGCTDPFGHWALAVENDIFDFGPLNESKKAKWLGGPGGRFWGINFAPSKGTYAGIKEIRKAAATYKCGIYEFRAKITPGEAKQLRDFWNKLYTSNSQYWYFGKQCTTSLFRALRSADLLPPRTLDVMPMSLYETLRKDFVSTCGGMTGQPLRMRLLNHPLPK